jgi:[acyl-carrier-protein] S-malonyltransferase
MGEPWRATDAWSVVTAISEVSGHDLEDLLVHTDDDALRRTDRAQIATFALEMVVLERYRAHDGADAHVAAAAGHSLGEYSALVAAGILDLGTATRLVAARGTAMLAAAVAVPGTMIAVIGAPAADVTGVLEPLQDAGTQIWTANFNAPDQTVLAGDHDGIERATEALSGTGRIVALPVGGAFHSPLMAPAEAPLRAALASAEFREGTMPVVANVDAQPHTGGSGWVERLVCQLTAPVRWTDSVLALTGGLACGEFVEIGPGNTLSNLVKRIARGTPTTRVAAP